MVMYIKPLLGTCNFSCLKYVFFTQGLNLGITARIQVHSYSHTKSCEVIIVLGLNKWCRTQITLLAGLDPPTGLGPEPVK